MYLFLRGMGLDSPHREHGVWFRRPEHARVRSLDRAFLGGDATVDAESGS